MSDATIGKAYVQIVPSSKGIAGSIKNALAPEANAAGVSAGGSIGGKILSTVKALGVGAAIMKSIKEGARYEQAQGGIETLFKESAGKMVKYANDAWKTAGLSANDYMEQTTSFAASLLQSLDGDTAKAAEAANQAVIDMSDNANKMGTDITSIQNAYQGFAKQNYTMLDNLKLGYGGTKTEMQRLLSDAEKLSGKKYDISNLNDVYEAIHIIQGELGITGTTAKEAESTLSGSFNSMKAAASNFMAQLTTGGDVNTALANLTDSAVTFFMGNLVPALGKIITSIPGVVITLIGTTLPNIIDSISEQLDKLLEGAGTEGALKMGESFRTSLLPAIGKLIPKLLGLFVKLPISLASTAIAAGAGFVKGLWDKIKSGVSGVVEKIKGFFKFNVSLPKIKLPHFSITPEGWKLGDLLKGIKPTLGIKWFAEGAILKQPTLFGGGEKGLEAVMPLSKLDSYISNKGAEIDYDRMAEAMAVAMSALSIDATLQLGDGKVLAQVLAPLILIEMNKKRSRENRKKGYL